jgi:hypothetical protein
LFCLFVNLKGALGCYDKDPMRVTIVCFFPASFVVSQIYIYIYSHKLNCAVFLHFVRCLAHRIVVVIVVVVDVVVVVVVVVVAAADDVVPDPTAEESC